MPPAYGPDGIAAARVDPFRVVLEGVHALKHAVRFGAELHTVITPDRAGLEQLLGRLAPDVTLSGVHASGADVLEVDRSGWLRATGGHELPSPALAVARRPRIGPRDVLDAPGPVVLLDEPRHPGNLGAAVRVAAAAGTAGVLSTGTLDPWHPHCVRGAAGLHFALPVARIDGPAGLQSHGGVASGSRPVVAVTTDGAGMDGQPLPADAVLAFGSERGGLSELLVARAELRVAIPMRAGVSSLNLATAVAACLYGGTFTAGTARTGERDGAGWRAGAPPPVS